MQQGEEQDAGSDPDRARRGDLTPDEGYAELCVTSNFTFLTGASHPEELVARAAELGLAAALTVPAGVTHLLPWLYWIFLFILLVDRAGRDEKRCAAKYGEAWATYREHVPWRILPGVY